MALYSGFSMNAVRLFIRVFFSVSISLFSSVCADLSLLQLRAVPAAVLTFLTYEHMSSWMASEASETEG